MALHVIYHERSLCFNYEELKRVYTISDVCGKVGFHCIMLVNVLQKFSQPSHFMRESTLCLEVGYLEFSPEKVLDYISTQLHRIGLDSKL